MAERPEPLRHKLLLLTLDKALLGGLVLLFGAVLTLFADRLQTVWSFQEKLFDQRLSAYERIARRADAVVIELVVWYDATGDATSPSAYRPWWSVYQHLRESVDELGGGSTRWTTSQHVVEAIGVLIGEWDRNTFLIPASLKRAFDQYLTVVLPDLQASLDDRTPETPDAEWRDRAQKRWSRALEAHMRLTATLRETIGLDLSPAETFQIRN